MAKLEELRQGKDQDVKELVTEFRSLVGKAKLKDKTDSDQKNLIQRFKYALNPWITLQILQSNDPPTTIKDWYKMAIKFDVS